MAITDVAITIEDLTVAYQEKPALWDVDLSIPKGVILAIVGPNGAGKTTLIKAILKLVPIVSGKVQIFGKPYTKQRKRVGYVPQRNSVDWDFPTTVLDVVLMGRYGEVGWIRRTGKYDKERALKALDQVGMIDFTKHHISELSGGQQQRVFLARTLVQDADIFIMDEPFQGVDMKTEKAIAILLKALRDQGKTVVVVHHDLDTLTEYYDWVTFLNVRVIAVGPIETTFTPEIVTKTYGGSFSMLNMKL